MHHHSTWQRIDMGRPARIVLHLLRTSVDVPVPGWMKSESKLFAKLESCEQQNWPTPGERGGPITGPGPVCHQQFDPWDSPGPSAPGFESCGSQRWSRNHSIPRIYTVKLTPCLPSRMQHIEIVVLPSRILRLWTLEHGNLWNMLIRVENIATKLALFAM